MMQKIDIARLKRFLDYSPLETLELPGNWYADEPLPARVRLHVYGTLQAPSFGEYSHIQADGHIEVNDIGKFSHIRSATLKVNGIARDHCELVTKPGDMELNKVGDDCYLTVEGDLTIHGTVGNRPHVDCRGINHAQEKTEPPLFLPVKNHAKRADKRPYGVVNLGGGIERDRINKCFYLLLDEKTLTPEMCALVAHLKTLEPGITITENTADNSYMIQEGTDTALNDKVSAMLLEYGIKHKAQERWL